MEVRLKEDFREEWSKCLFCKTQKYQKASSKINAAEEANNKKKIQVFFQNWKCLKQFDQTLNEPYHSPP